MPSRFNGFHQQFILGLSQSGNTKANCNPVPHGEPHGRWLKKEVICGSHVAQPEHSSLFLHPSTGRPEINKAWSPGNQRSHSRYITMT